MFWFWHVASAGERQLLDHCDRRQLFELADALPADLSPSLIGVLRHGSDFDLLGDFDSIIDLDAKITKRTLDLRTDQTQSN